MVKISDDINMFEINVPKYSIIEQALVAKNGEAETCEDAIYIDPHFVAVIDGATSKTHRRWAGKTGGRVAAELLREAFQALPAEVTAREAVDRLTAAIQDFYVREDVTESVRSDAVQRVTASVVAFSVQRKEVWLVGDCQCLLNQKHIHNRKVIDTITANARALFLETEIARGMKVETLQQYDTGRAFIHPLLERQMIFQNNPAAGHYWFPVIDGFAVPDDGISVFPLTPEIETLVLASDGYPFLKKTLAESEQALQEVLRDDPLLFRIYKSTKGLQQNMISFDDRAYVKLFLKDEA